KPGFNVFKPYDVTGVIEAENKEMYRLVEKVSGMSRQEVDKAIKDKADIRIRNHKTATANEERARATVSLLTQEEIEALWGEANQEPYADDVPLPEPEPVYDTRAMRQQLDVIIQAYKP